jgi:hypothetical protein
MKSILTKADVEKAKASLLSQGKRPTLAALHAALDNRGSMTTLVEIKAEIDAAKNTQVDSPEALESLRNIWALARAEERKEQEGQLAELRECIAALSNENQRLEGTSAAAEKRAGDMSEAKSQAEAALQLLRTNADRDLALATTAMRESGSEATRALRELAEERSARATQVAALRSELTSAQLHAHEFELQSVRARALLDAQGLANAKP